jgi:hypothetical protein
MFGSMSHEWHVQNGLIEEDGSPVCFNAPDDAADRIDDVDHPSVEPEVLTLSDDDSRSCRELRSFNIGYCCVDQ